MSVAKPASGRLALIVSFTALVVALAGIGAPSMARVYRVLNADKVDGFHAVKAKAKAKKRKGKLVAADKHGRAPDAALLQGKGPGAFLPSGGKAADADRLDGLDASAFLGAQATAANSQALAGRGGDGYLQVAAPMLAVASGQVSAPGVLVQGTPGLSVARTSDGYYAITLAGVTYTNNAYVTVATAIGRYSASTGEEAGKLRVYTDAPDGTSHDAMFSFVVFKLR